MEISMKLMTINTHSLVEKEYEKKLDYFVDYLSKGEYNIVAMQEVNQSVGKPEVTTDSSYIEADSRVKIREDNHIYNVTKRLKNKGKEYYWTWIPIKLGYDIYDEGIGFLSKKKPTEVVEFHISEITSYENWKSRKVVGIKIEDGKKSKWYFSVHLGWWNDKEEPFKAQFEKLTEKINSICNKEDEIYLMGDFNNPSQLRGQGYDMVAKLGWQDTYTLAETKDDGITVAGLIDGWKEYKELNEMRIDFIFVNKAIDVKSSKVIFSGKKEETISDHFGVSIEIVE